MSAQDTATRLAAATETIAVCRLEGRRLEPLPAERRPNDLPEAYRVQTEVAARLTAAGRGAPAGWKIGCTTKVMQDYLQIPHPCVGRLYAGSVQASGATLKLADFLKPAVELEIAVRLGADLPPRAAPYSQDDCAAAVDACLASLEIVDDRYGPWAEVGTPTLVADDFFSWGCVHGPAVTDWRMIDLCAEEAVIFRDGTELGRGRGAAILEHPLNALTWLANSGATPKGLKAGDLITLGSVVQTVWAEAPCEIVARYSTLGEVAVGFV